MKLSIRTVLLSSLAFLIAGCGSGEQSVADESLLTADESSLTVAPVYFLVDPIGPAPRESFIVPITNSADIDKARKMAAGLLPKKIFVANIAKGGSTPAYVNKDLYSGRKWSWRVTQFVTFADFTPELLDGWPSGVESNVDEWIRMTNGKIGFWRYSIRREVPVSQIRP